MNWEPPDPLAGPSSVYAYNWPVPSADGAAGQPRDSWSSFSGWMDSGLTAQAPSSWTTVLTGTTGVASAAATSSTFTVTNTGSNITFPAGSGSSFVSMAGYGRPEPEPERLEVRRFYHWNKSATAGAAAAPAVTQEEDVAGVSPAAAQVVVGEVPDGVLEPVRRRRLARRAVISPRSLTSIAVVLAGHKRGVDEEWRGHLLGEHAGGLTQREQARAARGFVLAAIRYRAQDATALAWRPADAVLGSRILSNLFVWGPVIVVLFAIVRRDGRFGLVADIQDPGTLGAFLYSAIRAGRWWRGIKPPDPRPRRTEQ
jgi:hypothetical protein